MREICIDGRMGGFRAAILEDGRLCEMRMGGAEDREAVETIYLARVMQIRPSLSAAFVDIGESQNAFLPLNGDTSLRCGDMIPVQSEAKQATAGKGLRVSRKINLTGKWLVLIPGESGVHLSKKIKDPALRDRLAGMGRTICPDGCGMIIRTVTAETDDAQLAKEAETLAQRWEKLLVRAKGMVRPGALEEAEPEETRLMRDLAGASLHRVVTNSRASFERLKALRDAGLILSGTEIEYFDEDAKKTLLFDTISAESQLEKALRRKVWLPCGGYLVIDRAEAATVIDVNSGKMVIGRDPEAAALKVNLEAAQETAVQLRLRGIGGMILIDFIDMMKPEHRETLTRALKEAVKTDSCQVRVEGLTRLGLMELTRKRRGAELAKVMRTVCPACGDESGVASTEAAVLKALTQLSRMVYAGQRGPFLITCGKSGAERLRSVRLPDSFPEIRMTVSGGKHSEQINIGQIGEGQAMPENTERLLKETEL